MRKAEAPSHSLFDRTLIRHLESCKNLNTYKIDEIVAELQSNYRRYQRIKVRPFRKRVEKALEFHRQRNIPSSTSDVDDDSTTNSFIAPPPHKKLKKIDEKEERLFRIETAHLLRKQREQCSTSTDDEDEDGAVSTSDDAMFESNVEPEFDLIKSMLRANYTNNVESSSKVVEEEKGKEKNLEVENCDEEKKVDFKDKGKELSGRHTLDEKNGPKFKDLGGIRAVLDELMMEVIVPLCHPELPRWLGVKPISGIMLNGPPGCGKTKLAHAIANETGLPFYKISAIEVISGVSGASEENIRDLFSKAYRTAPSIIFIDEIDAIASKRENLQREMERRIVTQLLTSMDDLHQIKGSSDVESDSGVSNQSPGYVLVIGATNRPDAVDAALRRPGRFDREIVLGVPDENARFEILSVLTQNLRLEGNFDLRKLATSTPGFVGADLAALANKAGNLAMKRIIDKRKSELPGRPGLDVNSGE